MKGYKAFNKGMICRDKQYEENTTYEENGSEICEAGVMHYCENPFDVLDYYPLIDDNGDMSEFAEVEPLGDVYREENKCATNKLHIGARLGLKGFVKACIDFILEKTKVETSDVDTTKASGDYSQLAASGDYSKLAASGNVSKLAASGDYSQLAASGDVSKLAASGDYSQLAASGDYSQLAASGDYSQLAASGDYSKLAASGNVSKLAASGKNSVVMAAGYNSIAKAKKGSWITLSEWVRTDDKNEKGFYIWIPKCVKTECVDGERIKEDTFYKLVDGEFTEVQ